MICSARGAQDAGYQPGLSAVFDSGNPPDGNCSRDLFVTGKTNDGRNEGGLSGEDAEKPRELFDFRAGDLESQLKNISPGYFQLYAAGKEILFKTASHAGIISKKEIMAAARISGLPAPSEISSSDLMGSVSRTLGIAVWFPGRPAKNIIISSAHSNASQEWSIKIFETAGEYQKDGSKPLLEARFKLHGQLVSAKIWEYSSKGNLSSRLWLNQKGEITKTVFANRRIFPLEEIYRESGPRGGKSIGEILSIAARDDRVAVAVLDTGVDYNHPALAWKMRGREEWAETASQWERLLQKKEDLQSGLSSLSLFSKPLRMWQISQINNEMESVKNESQAWDFSDNDPLPYDYDENPPHFSHGTSVAGIISRGSDDIALLPLRLRSTAESLTQFYEAVQYAWDRGARIINISFGYKGNAEKEELLSRTIKDFPDMLFVAAAGNRSINIDHFPDYPASFDFPNIITAASVDSGGNLSVFSSYGKESVDVAAYGERVSSYKPGGGIDWPSGTSAAAPQVSRLAAEIKHIRPELSPERIIEIIGASVDQKEGLREKLKYGGIINEGRALELARSGLPGA